MPRKNPTLIALEQQRDVLKSEREGYTTEIDKIDSRIAMLDEIMETVRKTIAKRKRTPKATPAPTTTAAA